MSVLPFPTCHLTHLPVGDGRRSAAVWVCEYPYRSLRASGPSSDCAECPVWQQMQHERGTSAAAEEVQILEAMAASRTA